MKYTVAEAVEQMAWMANEMADLKAELPEGVSLSGIYPQSVHVHCGLRSLAKEAGALVEITHRDSAKYPFKASFTAVGVTYSQFGKTQEDAIS